MACMYRNYCFLIIKQTKILCGQLKCLVHLSSTKPALDPYLAYHLSQTKQAEPQRLLYCHIGTLLSYICLLSMATYVYMYVVCVHACVYTCTCTCVHNYVQRTRHMWSWWLALILILLTVVPGEPGHTCHTGWSPCTEIVLLLCTYIIITYSFRKAPMHAQVSNISLINLYRINFYRIIMLQETLEGIKIT
jgi:hypothetical protein